MIFFKNRPWKTCNSYEYEKSERKIWLQKDYNNGSIIIGVSVDSNPISYMPFNTKQVEEIISILKGFTDV